MCLPKTKKNQKQNNKNKQKKKDVNSIKLSKVPVSVSRSMSGGTMGMASWGWAAAATSPRRAGSRPCRAFVCNGYVCAAPPHSLQEPLQESYRQHMLPLEEIVRLVQSGIRIKKVCPKTDLCQQGETDPVEFSGNFAIDFSEVRILLKED